MESTILLVEDNCDDVLIFKRAFKKADLTLALAVVNNGQEAIDYLLGRLAFRDRQYPLPCLIFLDLKTPLKTGFDVLDWLSKNEAMRTIPAVVLSSSDEPRDVDKALQLGARAYVVKPPIPEKLVELVDSFVISETLTSPVKAGK